MGIDPGTKGAIAVLNTDGAPRIAVYPFPTVTLHIGNKNRTRLDMDACWALVSALTTTFEPAMCFLEDVNGFGGNPAATAAAAGVLMQTAGAVEAFLVAAAMPRRRVPPATWKKALSIRGTGKEGKNASRVSASQLFPEHADLFSRVKDDGVAEAALIAWYGATQIMGYRQ